MKSMMKPARYPYHVVAGATVGELVVMNKVAKAISVMNMTILPFLNLNPLCVEKEDIARYNHHLGKAKGGTKY